ncbi:MAG: hypothetical protein IPM50_15345 [Acidobacteriota bacterium]|nr:MAG: hypothetical protein IPM50_15345 [Acidobacteriota bacterium]
MRADLSNQVIARIDEKTRHLPSRTLDLGNILTLELGLLSPHRSEIAPRGRARDAALIAYSERLRQSYRANEAGIRDGMLKLGEAYRQGQTIAVSCFCRGGGLCHADVVKLAIEKVAGSLAREAERQKSHGVIEQNANTIQPNPRTERAVNEILSVSKSDLILSKLEDAEGRNRSEHASHLNGHSQFVRDLYERGAVVRDGVLISPKENASSSAPLGITTAEYAVKRLEPIVNESRAKEIAPQLVKYGNRIAGGSADRDTKIKVFNWIYGALEGRNDFLKAGDKTSVNESKEERFERTLEEIASLAEEMGRLEPSDRLVAVESLNEQRDIRIDRSGDDLSLENIYEDSHLREEPREAAEIDHVGGIREFERIELQDVTLARLADEMSKDELDRWVEVRLPVIDEMLESGTPVDSILKPFQNEIYQAAKEDTASKQAAIDDLRFASGYIQHQLKQPESRLRHFNARYREYALMLEKAVSRDELIDAASKIRRENAKDRFWVGKAIGNGEGRDSSSLDLKGDAVPFHRGLTTALYERNDRGASCLLECRRSSKNKDGFPNAGRDRSEQRSDASDREPRIATRTTKLGRFAVGDKTLPPKPQDTERRASLQERIRSQRSISKTAARRAGLCLPAGSTSEGSP